MAARGRILAAMLFSCAVLPLLATAFLPVPDGVWDPIGLLDPGQNNDDDNNNNFVPQFPVQDPHDEVEGDEEPAPIEEKPLPEVRPDPQPKPVVKPVPNPVEKAAPKPEPKPMGPVKAGLREGFYAESCPQAEKIVKESVDKILERDPRVGPGIVRLFFHDCFVTGCDASIFLEKTPSGERVEKDAPPNGQYLRGLAEIEEIKTQLEAACPRAVSCADTLAFATRDVLSQIGVPRYNIPGGRRDRRASSYVKANTTLPYPNTPVVDVVQRFDQKGLTLEDLVVLIGAHSIGEAHCDIVQPRIYDEKKKEEMDAKYRDELLFVSMCDKNVTIPFDQTTPHMMDSGFYKQLLAKRALLEFDGNLVKVPAANTLLKRYAADQEGWLKKFAQTMVKLGGVEVLTGNEGEIRKQCKFVN